MTDTQPSGWPDPARPGYPLHPNTDGWHWLCAAAGIGAPYPMLWSGDGKAWDTGDGWVFCTDPALTERRRYLGPCILPADLAAERAAAAEAMREACAARLEEMRLEHNAAMIGIWHTMDTSLAYGDGAEAIRALPIPDASALAERDHLAAENARLRSVLRSCATWADRHGKEPDWLEDARAAAGREAS